MAVTKFERDMETMIKRYSQEKIGGSGHSAEGQEKWGQKQEEEEREISKEQFIQMMREIEVFREIGYEKNENKTVRTISPI